MTKQERQLKERLKADKRNALDGFKLYYEEVELKNEKSRTT